MEDASSELRLFLQGICCDYLLFRHLDEGVPPEAIRIRQEVALSAGAFADIEVRAGQAPLYFVEVDTGYSRERLLDSRTSAICAGFSANALASRSTLWVRTISSPSETRSTTPRASMPLAKGSRMTPSRPPSSGTLRSGACAACARLVGLFPVQSCRQVFAGMWLS